MQVYMHEPAKLVSQIRAAAHAGVSTLRRIAKAAQAWGNYVTCMHSYGSEHDNYVGLYLSAAQMLVETDSSSREGETLTSKIDIDGVDISAEINVTALTFAAFKEKYPGREIPAACQAQGADEAEGNITNCILSRHYS